MGEEMKLTELDPRWLFKDGRRIGFIFISPTDPKYYQSCFSEPTPSRLQWELFEQVLNDEHGASRVQGSKPTFAWTFSSDTFDTLTVTPSIDGSPGGLWHGFITNGEIRYGRKA
jgi:hypothetical protein